MRSRLSGVLLPFWLAGWTLMAVLNLAAGVVMSSVPERQNDLKTIERWGRAWLVNGSNVYRLDEEQVDYPPHAIVVLSPLGLLPETVSVPIWASLNLALSVLAVYLAVRTARPKAPLTAIALGARSSDAERAPSRRAPRAAIFEIISVFSRRSRPTRSVFGYPDTLLAMAMFLCWGGFRTLLQFSLLTLTLGLAAIVLADRRPARSGICLGLSLMKPQIAIPFVLWAVFTRRLRVLIVAATVVVGGFLVYCLRAWVSPVAVVVRYTEILGTSYWDPTTDLVGLAQARPLVALVMSRPGSVNAVVTALALVLLAGICALGYLEGRDRPTLMFSAPALAGVWSLMTFYHLTYGFILLLPVATLLLWVDDPGSQVLRARIFWVLQAGLMFDVPGLWRRFGVPLHLPSSVDAVLLHADRVLIAVLFAAVTVLSFRNRHQPHPRRPAVIA
jgi:hypothetical protein